MLEYTQDYLLNKKVLILQPMNGYRASSDAVFLAALPKVLKADERLLDVGSGTGAVSLCLAHHYPQNSVTGLEIQRDLAELSQQSAALNGFRNLTFVQGDLYQKKHPFAHAFFDHVVTNPPYYDVGQPLSPNPSKALAHQYHRASLEKWLLFCLKMLKPFGRLAMINRVENLPQILKTLEGRAGDVRVIPFYTAPFQPAKRILLTAQKDSKAPLSILEPFVAYDADHHPTLSADKILRDGKSFFDY